MFSLFPFDNKLDELKLLYADFISDFEDNFFDTFSSAADVRNFKGELINECKAVERYGFDYLNPNHQQAIRNKDYHSRLINYYASCGLDADTFYKCSALKLSKNFEVVSNLMGEWQPNFTLAIENVNNQAFRQYTPGLEKLLRKIQELKNISK